MSRVLNAVLTHTPPGEIARSVEWWSHVAPPEALLIVHGGPAAEFGAIGFANKVHVPAQRLRTADHPRERQSYTEVYAAVSEWMRGRDFSHVYFAEFDHLPLVADLDQRLLGRLAGERADVLCHGVRRVDDTGWHHYLYHRHDPRFHEYWEKISRREDRRVVLSMLGTGSFWTREAFDAVAESRKWKEAVARETAGMTAAERIAYFNSHSSLSGSADSASKEDDSTCLVREEPPKP